MIILDKPKGWDNKVNFVDENNVFLGYDLNQQCCENAGWFISDKIESEILEPAPTVQIHELRPYVFDPYFFQGGVQDTDPDWEESLAIFKLVSPEVESKPKYIHLYNVHNGYYAHGFVIRVRGNIIKDGSL